MDGHVKTRIPVRDRPISRKYLSLAMRQALVLVIGFAALAAAYSPASLPLRPQLPPLAARRCMPPRCAADDPPLVDRVAAAAPYILPALDGFVYGGFVYANVPPVGAVAYTFLPGARASDCNPLQTTICLQLQLPPDEVASSCPSRQS